MSSDSGTDSPLGEIHEDGMYLREYLLVRKVVTEYELTQLKAFGLRMLGARQNQKIHGRNLLRALNLWWEATHDGPETPGEP